MESRIAELRDKEIINISDGCRFGYVGDVEVDLETGRVKALIVPGRLRFFGLSGGRRIRSSPGSPSGVLERISFWWRRRRLAAAGGNEKGMARAIKHRFLNKIL